MLFATSKLCHSAYPRTPLGKPTAKFETFKQFSLSPRPLPDKLQFTRGSCRGGNLPPAKFVHRSREDNILPYNISIQSNR